MLRYAIIVAGGKGLRMGAQIPKQFLVVGGLPLLMHTIDAFIDYDSQIKIILVLPESQRTYWTDLCLRHNFSSPHIVVSGGDTRFQSVKNGLDMVEKGCLVAVHDGVRPFVSKDVIDRCFTLAEKMKAVIPVVSVVDSMRHFVEGGDSVAVSRNDYCLVQTPQVFCSTLLKEAYNQSYTDRFTDDASVVEAYGAKVYLTEGNRENIKITTPFDLKIASALLV